MEQLQLTKESFTNYSYFESSDPTHNKSAKNNNIFVTYLTVFQSEHYCINDLNCCYDSQHIFKPTYTCRFSINLTRCGYFTFKTYRRLEEEYTSRIMLEKPGCEFKFIQQVPGSGGCTVLSFTEEGYALLNDLYSLQSIAFFSNPDWFSVVLSADASTDLLHYYILQHIRKRNGNRLETECLVAELIDNIMQLLMGNKPCNGLLNNKDRYHLKTLERAKEYMLDCYTEDIALNDLASYCYISPFYFTRVFKQLCGCSPFNYLQQVRLKQAEIMLRTTDMPVADISFKSGFNRLDYFSSAFRKQFELSPSKYRVRFRN